MAIPLERIAEPATSDSQASDPVETEPVDDRPLSALNYRLTVLRHHRRVFQLSASLLRDEAEAEDVTQETFIRYWELGAAVRKPQQWLLKVARNRCLDRIRKSNRFVDTADGALLEQPDVHDPEWHYGQSELSGQLRRLVDGLPEPQRSLVVLFDVQGLSGDECARVVGISPGQVRVYLHRARRRLRSKLEQSR